MEVFCSFLSYLLLLSIGSCEWWSKRLKRVATLEFDRIRKSMSVIVREPNGRNRLLVKVTIIIDLHNGLNQIKIVTTELVINLFSTGFEFTVAK